MFQPRKREAASLARIYGRWHGTGISFQPRKREAASLALFGVQGYDVVTGVSTPQAGSGLFSLLYFVVNLIVWFGFNPASGKRPL